MKAFKTVMILSLAILSLGTSVAFGDCIQTEVSSTKIDGTKAAQIQQGQQAPINGAQTQAGQTH